jgi:hypothetical protein
LKDYLSKNSNYINKIMDNQSNSRFYHGDCKCIKKPVKSTILIQCGFCIDNQCIDEYKHKSCKCTETTITHNICVNCADIRDKIDMLDKELDTVMYNVANDIRQFIDCTDEINSIYTISTSLRFLNKELLENLVK